MRTLTGYITILILFFSWIFEATAHSANCILPHDREIPSGYSPFKKATPWIVCADVNGDGIEDQFIAIANSTAVVVIAYISKKKTFSTYSVLRQDKADIGDEFRLWVGGPGDELLANPQLNLCGTVDIRCTQGAAPVLHSKHQYVGVSQEQNALIFQWLGYGFRTLYLGD